MPVENEFAYVLADPQGTLEAALKATVGVRGSDLRQGYLHDDLRIRCFADHQTRMPTYVMSFKRRIDGEVVEHESPMDGSDFVKLFPTCGVRLVKTRYAFDAGSVHWDVDYFRDAAGRTYFVKAEAEVPSNVKTAPPPAPELAPYVMACVGKSPEYASLLLADRSYALDLLAAMAPQVPVSLSA